MPYWLSSSKVRLGLLVNGLYLFSLLVPSSQIGGRPYPNDYGGPDFARPRRAPVSVQLPPRKGRMMATAHRDTRADVRTIYLERDITLRETMGHRLLLDPLFNVTGGDTPDSVLLRFVSFSDEPLLMPDNSLSITADGRQVWPAAYSPEGGRRWRDWKEELVPPFVTRDGGGVIENVGKNIPYEVFAEVIGAKRAVVTLGPYVLNLKEEQLEALRDMHRLWADSPAPAGVRKQF